MLKGSLLLSRILYQQQQTLPSAEELSDMTNRIADLRLEQFEVNQQRDALFQSDAYVAKLEEGTAAMSMPKCIARFSKSLICAGSCSISSTNSWVTS